MAKLRKTPKTQQYTQPNQCQLFIQAGLIDIEQLNAKGEFSANFIVQAAVGTK